MFLFEPLINDEALGSLTYLHNGQINFCSYSKCRKVFKVQLTILGRYALLKYQSLYFWVRLGSPCQGVIESQLNCYSYVPGLSTDSSNFFVTNLKQNCSMFLTNAFMHLSPQFLLYYLEIPSKFQSFSKLWDHFIQSVSPKLNYQPYLIHVTQRQIIF